MTLTPFAESTILSLARALDRADEQPFREAAETAIEALPVQGDGVAFRTLREIWRRFFKPPEYTGLYSRSLRDDDEAL
jgi:hypothetical protein